MNRYYKVFMAFQILFICIIIKDYILIGNTSFKFDQVIILLIIINNLITIYLKDEILYSNEKILISSIFSIMIIYILL